MLNFFAKIKEMFKVSSFTFIALLGTSHSAPAQAQDNIPKKQLPREAPDEGFVFYATARLLSPDRKVELSAPEVKVNLTGMTTVALRGRGIRVVLASEPDHFRKTQSLSISASNDGARFGSEVAALNAGMFRLSANNEHSFLYTDKLKGWVLEVRLRPIQPSRSQDSNWRKSRMPVRRFLGKTKRAPV